MMIITESCFQWQINIHFINPAFFSKGNLFQCEYNTVPELQMSGRQLVLALSHKRSDSAGLAVQDTYITTSKQISQTEPVLMVLFAFCPILSCLAIVGTVVIKQLLLQT